MPRIKALILSLLLLVLLALPLQAVQVDVPQEVGRGEPFWIKLESERQPMGLEISWLERSMLFPLDLPGEQSFLLGAGLESQGERTLALKIYWADHSEQREYKVKVKDKQFPEQHLDLPEEMVAPPQETLKRIDQESRELKAALETITLERYWTEDFSLPLPTKISSQFGLQRYLNGEPRSAHKGVDLRGDQGQPVLAIARGQVALLGDYYFGGKTVLINHGQGLHSLYMHLSSIQVKKGQMVQTGEVIGQVGSTGRSTGPHLHLGVYLQGQAVDPMHLLSPD
ncbi:MAG: M23 family metallopeptidase [Desulfohalobiaceae bacterium]